MKTKRTPSKEPTVNNKPKLSAAETKRLQALIKRAASMAPTIVRRFFLVEDLTALAMMQEIQEAIKVRDAALTKLRRSIKCSDIYVNEIDGSLSFTFKNKPNLNWTNIRSRRRSDLYRPSKVTAEGKLMAARLKELPEYRSQKEILPLFGLPQNFPMYFAYGYTYYAGVVYLSSNESVYLSVPYMNFDPEVLEAYLKLGNSDLSRIELTNLDAAAAWLHPPKTLTEVKEWELQKAIADHNESLKVKRPASKKKKTPAKTTKKVVKRVARKVVTSATV